MSKAESGDERGHKWEGYSDFQTVSRRNGRSIDDALDAYAHVQRIHQEGGKVRNREAAEAGARILSAALRLVPELQANREQKEKYDEILSRWLDGQYPDEFDGPSEGFIDALNEVQLYADCPDWLFRFVLDLRTAGWHLGYLQAGREVEEDADDPVEADVEAMFE